MNAKCTNIENTLLLDHKSSGVAVEQSKIK